MTSNFVTQDHRFLQANGAETAVVVVMQIRAANATGGHTNQHFASARFRRFALLHTEIAGGMDDDGLHEICLVWSEEQPLRSAKCGGHDFGGFGRFCVCLVQLERRLQRPM